MFTGRRRGLRGWLHNCHYLPTSENLKGADTGEMFRILFEGMALLYLTLQYLLANLDHGGQVTLSDRGW